PTVRPNGLLTFPSPRPTAIEISREWVREDPNIKIQTTARLRLDLGIWIFSGSWCLDLGSYFHSRSRRRVPAGIGPERAADCGVGNHEANRICDFLRLNQAPELRFGDDEIADKFLSQR